jgi:hypothetical protein
MRSNRQAISHFALSQKSETIALCRQSQISYEQGKSDLWKLSATRNQLRKYR